MAYSGNLPSLLGRSKKIVWFLLLLNIALYFFRPLSFPDLWWQWDDGRQILHTFHYPQTARLTFADPAPRFMDEYVLFEALLYLGVSIGGLVLIALGYWILATAPFFAAYLIALRRSGQQGPVAFVLFGLCVILAAYIQQRPAVLGNLFLFLLALTLLRAENILHRRAFLVAAGVLFCLWSNTHSSYVIGLFVLGLYLAERVIKEGPFVIPRALLFLAVAVLATAIHPYGILRWEFTLGQYRDPWGYVISSEMWPPPLFYQFVIVAGLLAGLWLYFRSGQKSWWWLAALGAVALLSLSSYRFSNHLAALLLVALAFPRRSSSSENPPFWTLSALAANCLLSTLLLVGLLAEFRIIQSMTQRKIPWINPETSCAPLLDQMAAAPEKQPVLSDTVVSAYAYYHAGDRLLTLNETGMARYAQDTKRYYYYLSFFPEAFAVALDQLHIDQVVISNRDFVWASVLNGRPDWRLTQITPNGLLYSRLPAAPFAPSDLRPFLNTVRGEARIAFAVHLLPDDEALAFLKTNDHYLDEEVYVAIDRALSLLPTDEVQQFYGTTDPAQIRPFIRLLILKRLGRFPEAAALARAWSPWGTRWADQMPRAEAFFEAGDFPAARQALGLLYPRPPASRLYNDLRTRLLGPRALAWAPLGTELLWTADSQAWFIRTTARWNSHLPAQP
jgi:hypothetical protein